MAKGDNPFPCHSHFDATRRGIPPPCRVVPIFEATGIPLPVASKLGTICGPSPSCCFPIDTTRRGCVPLPRRVLPISMWQGGVSPPCPVVFLLTQQVGGVCPLLVTSFPFQCDREGWALPVLLFSYCLLSISIRQRGASPSPSCWSPIDTTRRGVASFLFSHDREGACSSSSSFLFPHDKKGRPPVVFFPFWRDEPPLIVAGFFYLFIM